MEKRNLTPLRNVLVRYLVVCGGGSIVILLVWWGLFMSLIRNGFLLPPVTGAQVCSEARDYAATATVETFDPNAIDPLCRYAILQAGTAHVLQTNMTAGQLKKARNILAGGRQWVMASYQYVVDMADGARCILQYDYSVPYADPALREVLPDFQTMYILLLILLEVIWLALCTHCTVKVLTGETRKLTKASAAIAAQRPEEIEVSGAKVREFAETLRAMQTMGSQLTASLQSQWKLEQQRAEQTAALAHDLKTPLTLILSPLQRLIQQPQISNNDKEKLEVIYRNANRMNYLINELLTFSKIEMKQMRISVRKGDIMHFLEELSHIFDIVAGEREIDFIVNLEDTEEEVWFSPSKLERILYNLLSNAFKYTQPGGYVKLSAKLIKEEKGTFVQISVKDNGRGIPKEAQEQIFESYYQVEKRDHREGFGLGLSLTRSLIHMHKGEIRVESEINKGSDFIVTLNVSEDAYNPDERSSENITTEEIQKYNQRIKETIELIPEKLTNKEKDPARESIMIVEDNKEMNDYLASIFSEKYDIIRAYNGAEACKKIAKQLPNLIISDLMMPVMDGLEFTERVKQDVTTSHIPVILLTAKTDENDHTEGYLRGADAYITKPFNAKNLELLVQNIQKSRKQSIEHFKQAEELNIKQITNNPRDEIFMQELMELIMANLTKEDFGVTEITAHLRISRSLLHMKLKSLTGCSITQFIRTIKMKEAKTHLLNGMNVSEASFAVGISDPNYFTKCFKKEFNITPTEFLKQLK